VKRKNAQLFRTAESDYNIRPYGHFPYWTLNEGAVKLGITPQRMSRLLRILEVPVHRRGYTIFLDTAALRRIRKALDSGEVRPGRKKKTEVA
jgi:hypothetical protein